MDSKDNICAIITTYNPDFDFRDRLDLISKHVEKVVIVDNNSDSITKKILFDISTDSKILVIFNEVNMGVAAALNQGIYLAKNASCSWVLLFDQDTRISENFVEVLFSSYCKIAIGEQIGVIGPSYFDVKSRDYLDQTLTDYPNYFKEVKFIITSGSLIAIDVYEKIGPFREDLFIDFVDIEYCLRARIKGFKIFQLLDLSIQHSIGSVTMHKLLWGYTGTSNHSPLRRYFMMRNNIFVAREYIFSDPAWALNSIYLRLKSTILMILFEKQRMLKLKYSIYGIIDGIMGNISRNIK